MWQQNFRFSFQSCFQMFISVLKCKALPSVSCEINRIKKNKIYIFTELNMHYKHLHMSILDEPNIIYQCGLGEGRPVDLNIWGGGKEWHHFPLWCNTAHISSYASIPVDEAGFPSYRFCEQWCRLKWMGETRRTVWADGTRVNHGGSLNMTALQNNPQDPLTQLSLVKSRGISAWMMKTP